jgi:hypothetical protein
LTLSTKSISSTAAPEQGVSLCTSCAAPLVEDQRYCLECGERRAPRSSEFLRAAQPASSAAAAPPSPPTAPPLVAAAEGSPGRSQNTLSLLAGVGVLLIAMGVGVLIGRSGGSTRASTTPEIVTVAGSTASPGSATAAEEPFTSSWPAGTKGFTVALETLPQTGTTVAQVTQAKTRVGTRGASSVGALKSEEFSSLTAGSYVIYSGVYHKRAEAQKALGSLQKKFPSARVIEVSEGTGAGSEGAGTKGTGSEAGSSKKASRPEVVKGVNEYKGKSYVEKSRNLPDEVSTG